MRQFAYVDEEGQIRVRDLDADTEIAASSEPASAGQFACSWPTWSPGGSHLAYVRYEFDGGRARSASIQVVGPDGTHRFEAYRASGLPIYFNWAPNGRRLAVLVQEEEALALRISDVNGAAQVGVVAQGSPLYFAWHPDSEGLIAHVGGDVLGAGRRRLVWIRLDGGQVSSHLLDESPATGFRAPSWSSVLQGVTVSLEKNGDQEIALAVAPDAPVRTLFRCGLAPAFVWSPGGKMLACTYRGSADAPYDGIWLYRTDQQTLDRLTDTNPLAFFWCGDDRLVCATGPVGDRSVGLLGIDVANGNQEDYGYVRPSRDLLLLFGHFDQYAGSAQLLSPAGNELLVAASRAKEQENGSVPTVRQIIVRPLASKAPDRVVGRGRVAFWRPQPDL